MLSTYFWCYVGMIFDCYQHQPGMLQKGEGGGLVGTQFLLLIHEQQPHGTTNRHASWFCSNEQILCASAIGGALPIIALMTKNLQKLLNVNIREKFKTLIKYAYSNRKYLGTVNEAMFCESNYFANVFCHKFSSLNSFHVYGNHIYLIKQ
jgi:hypothetical protein